MRIPTDILFRTVSKLLQIIRQPDRYVGRR